MALHYEREMNKALGRPADEPSDSARSRIRSVGDAVVQYMLFRDEARLTDRDRGHVVLRVRLRRARPPRLEGPVAPRPRPQDPAVPLPVQLPDLFPGLRLAPRRGEGPRLSTALGDPQRPGDREGRPAARRGGSRGDPRDPPRDEAGPAGLLEGQPRVSPIGGLREKRIDAWNASRARRRFGRIARSAFLRPAHDGRGRRPARRTPRGSPRS